MLKLADFSQDSRYRQAFSQLLSRIIHEYLSSELSELPAVVERIAQEVMEWSDFPRIGLFMMDEPSRSFGISREYCRESETALLESMAKMPFDIFPLWMDMIKSGRLLHVPDVNRLPGSASSEQSILTFLKIRSGIAIAVYCRNKPVGFVVFVGQEDARVWSEDDGVLLRLIASILGHMMCRQLGNGVIENRVNQYELAIDQLEKGMEETKRLAFEAVFANSSKSEFLEKLSRDIDLSIKGILKRLKRLESSHAEPETVDDIRAISEMAGGIQQVTNQVSQYVQLEDGNLVLTKEPFNIVDRLKRIEADYCELLNLKGVALKFRIGSSVPEWVSGDSGCIEQIIRELLDNASHATSEGSIGVIVDWEGQGENSGQFLVTVTDTGIGIAEEDIEIIFDAFVSLDRLEHEIQRTGLGLTIARSLALIMGGKLTCLSEKGQWSKFQLMLPLVKSTETLLQSSSVSIATPTDTESADESNLIEVLLYESNMINRRVAEKLLGKLGCNVTMINDGETMIEFLRTHAVDIIFLELEIGVQIGFDLSHQIRKSRTERGTQEVPIIAMVNSDSSGITTKHRDAGITDHVTKPISLVDLKRILTKHVIQKSEKDIQAESTIDSIDLEKLFNKAELLERLGGDESVIKELIPLFIGDIAERIQRIDGLITAEDYDSIGNEAHTVKGASYNVGARLLGDSAYRLENVARGRDGSDDPIGKLREAYGEMQRLFKTLAYHLVGLELLDLGDLPGVAGDVHGGEDS